MERGSEKRVNPVYLLRRGNGKYKEKSASCAEVINLIINRLQAVKIGSLTKVHIVGHKSTFRGPRKYILSATKVYGVKHGCTTRNEDW